MIVNMLNPNKLKNYENNDRTHSNAQIDQIIDSIRDFVILSGHARVKRIGT